MKMSANMQFGDMAANPTLHQLQFVLSCISGLTEHGREFEKVLYFNFSSDFGCVTEHKIPPQRQAVQR